MLQSAYRNVATGVYNLKTPLSDSDVGYDTGVCAALLEDIILKWVMTEPSLDDAPDFLHDLFGLFTQALDLNGMAGVELAWRNYNPLKDEDD